jgi:hypothetical protein
MQLTYIVSSWGKMELIIGCLFRTTFRTVNFLATWRRTHLTRRLTLPCVVVGAFSPFFSFLSLRSRFREAHHKKSVLYQTRTEEAPTKTDWLFQQDDQLYHFIIAQANVELEQAAAFLQH